MQGPDFTGAEWELLAEILGSERVKLLTEIRRTDTHSFRDELRARLETVDRMIEKATPLAAAAKA